MILKKRGISSKQLLLEVIERRACQLHADLTYYQELLKRTRAGVAGELRVDRAWEEIHVQYAYYVLHDIELISDSGYTHQMDTLFICQYFILIVEIKNIVGRVEYMENNHQFIRTTTDGKVDGFHNPFDQAKRHARFLRHVINKQGLDIPISYVIVSANPNMIMTSSLWSQPIIHVSGLAEKIEQLFQQHTQTYMDEKRMTQVAEHILKMHKPTPWRFNINWTNHLKGALCSHCEFQNVLRYHYGKWRCEVCSKIDSQALLYALHDYRYIYGEQISNSSFGDFFGISCSKTIYKLLKSLQFQEIGANKNRKYIIPPRLLER